MNRNLKVLLRGDATHKEEVQEGEDTYTVYHAISAEDMHHRCGLIPLFLELRVRRLLWFQSMIGDLAHHRATVSCLLGGLEGHRQPLAAD